MDYSGLKNVSQEIIEALKHCVMLSNLLDYEIEYLPARRHYNIIIVAYGFLKGEYKPSYWICFHFELNKKLKNIYATKDLGGAEVVLAEGIEAETIDAIIDIL